MSARVLLAFDTATPDTSVAVCGEGNGEVEAERLVGPGENGRPRHARSLLRAVEETVAESGGWGRVRAIVAGLGPGSFTGVRIGVATARALAQARRLPVSGVASPAALAAGLGQPGADRIGLIDARRGELFASVLRAGRGGADAPLRLRPERLGELAVGLTFPAAAGDGAVRFRQELQAVGITVPADSDAAHRLSARHLCSLARGVEDGDPGKLTPIYLRRPDAEIWRQRDGKH